MKSLESIIQRLRCFLHLSKVLNYLSPILNIYSPNEFHE